jgi:hypothetical protein
MPLPANQIEGKLRAETRTRFGQAPGEYMFHEMQARPFQIASGRRFENPNTLSIAAPIHKV